MQKIIRVSEARAADRRAVKQGIPSVELMQRAAEGIYHACTWRGKIGVVCGAGNNAGDGYALAMLLWQNGHDAAIVVLTEKLSEDGSYFYEKAQRAGVPVLRYAPGVLAGYDMLVDCILGTGFSGTLQGVFRQAVEEMNKIGAYVVSADIPSGLHAENGLCELCVKADQTVVIAALKTGEVLNQAKDVMGRISIADIGIAPDSSISLIAEEDCKAILKKRAGACHKGNFGTVAVMGGCRFYPGAIKLSARGVTAFAGAALRSGCGIARLCVPQSILPAFLPEVTEVTLYPMPDQEGFLSFAPEALDEALAGTTAACVGMGWGRGPDHARIISYLLSRYQGTLIVDADGLNALADGALSVLDQKTCRVVITPHPGEFARLIQKEIKDVLQNPMELAKQFALQHDVTVLLKGPATVVTDGRETYVSNRGCPGMATAGSGDVLSGILGGLFGYSQESLPLTAAVGAYINGAAGEAAQQQINEISMVSSDTVGQIAPVVSRLMQREPTHCSK
ncbi:MAG: NAD(P)H-hydrate dehydratase [Clostridiales bacterium]|nr:NAD(P)H-hydrate dehydratase [Clostridiales bacterium]